MTINHLNSHFPGETTLDGCFLMSILHSFSISISAWDRPKHFISSLTSSRHVFCLVSFHLQHCTTLDLISIIRPNHGITSVFPINPYNYLSYFSIELIYLTLRHTPLSLARSYSHISDNSLHMIHTFCISVLTRILSWFIKASTRHEIPMTLSHLQGHSPTASVTFRTAMQQVTRFHLAQCSMCGPSVIAELLAIIVTQSTSTSLAIFGYLQYFG